MISFPGEIRVPIANHLTHRRYTLLSAAVLKPDAKTLGRIVSICNEPEIYRWLFEGPLAGSAYTEKQAREWIEWSNRGWRSNTHFVFAVVDDTLALAAGCDIKSNQLNAEIGYWCSREHTGVMTNAVLAIGTLATAAGFTSLFARTKQDNVRSQAVLRRAGFQRSMDASVDHDVFVRPLA